MLAACCEHGSMLRSMLQNWAKQKNRSMLRSMLQNWAKQKNLASESIRMGLCRRGGGWVIGWGRHMR